MQYTIEKGDTTRIYEVIYDKEKLEELLNKIVRESSYKVKGEFILKVSEVVYGFDHERCYGIRKLPSLLNGDPIYQDVTKVYDDHDGLSRERVFVNGSKVILPKLAYIIFSILNGDVDAIKLLFEYASDDELKPIDIIITKKIDRLVEIKADLNANNDELVEISKQLTELGERKKVGHYFDLFSLNKCYSEAVGSISFELISEIRKPSGPVRKLCLSEVLGSGCN
jgi:hypothetical protein